MDYEAVIRRLERADDALHEARENAARAGQFGRSAQAEADAAVESARAERRAALEAVIDARTEARR